MAILLSLPLIVWAQSPPPNYGTPVYSGGLYALPAGNKQYQLKTTGSPWPYTYGGYSQTFTGSAPATASCAGDVTATFTWPAASGPTPPAVIIEQQATALWNGGTGASGSSNNPLGGANPGKGIDWVAAKYTGQNTPPTSLVMTLSGLSASGSPPPPASGGSVAARASYQVSVSPVTINLVGTTPDANGNMHILIGQKCSATLSSMPSGCTATNIQWSVDGWTVQANSWVVSSGSASATFTGPNVAYTFTQATPSATPPSWYWDDNAGPMTVTCTATVTPPTGQGAAFTVTAKRVVALEVPLYSNSEPVGVVYLNNVYLGNPGYNLHAGANPDQVPGIYFRDTVTTPPLYTSAGTGFWYRTQLASVSWYEIAKGGTPTRGAPGNTMPGAQDPYHLSNGGITYVYNNQTINADGSLFNAPFTVPENDSPGIQLSDTYQEYQVTKEKYEDYIMYHPPGDSIDVPLFYFQWSWNADVVIPPAPTPASWSHWNNAPTGGTITAPADGATQRMLIYPTWTSIVNPDLPA